MKTINVFKNKKLRVVLILVICSIFIINFSHQYINEHITLDSNQVTLSKCVDGDTAHFYINGKNVKVRFLAIDTPETVKQEHQFSHMAKKRVNLHLMH